MECKGRLFRQCRIGIVNGDDGHAGDIVEGRTCELETYGTGKDAMLRAERICRKSSPARCGPSPWPSAGRFGYLLCPPGNGGRWRWRTGRCIRSRQRRYEMGEVSGRLADFTVITSDNPAHLEMAADGDGAQGVVYAEPSGRGHMGVEIHQARHMEVHPQLSRDVHQLQPLRPQHGVLSGAVLPGPEAPPDPGLCIRLRHLHQPGAGSHRAGRA